jgi:uncharacterized membrane protein YqjE
LKWIVHSLWKKSTKEKEKGMHHMKKSGIVSVAAFIISLVIYAAWFFNENLFSNSAMIAALVLPIIGLITAFFTKKKSLKIVGLLGNSLVLLWAVIVPLASMLFWSQP